MLMPLSYCKAYIRSICIILAGIGILAGLAGLAFDASSRSAAELTYTWDFGVGQASETIEHVFALHNTGLDSKKISAIRTSCACTIVASPADLMASGLDAIPLRLRLPDRAGQFDASATISFRDGSTIRLQVVGMVSRPVPASVDFGEIRLDAFPSATFNVDHPDKPVVELGEGTSIAVSGMERVSPIRWRVTLGMSPSAEGDFRRSITVRTGHGSAVREWPVDVFGHVTRRVELRPSRLVWSKGADDKAVVEVQAPYGNRIKLVRASCYPNELLSVGAELYDGANLLIPVELRGSDPGISSGTLTLELEVDDEIRYFRLPIYAVGSLVPRGDDAD